MRRIGTTYNFIFNNKYPNSRARPVHSERAVNDEKTSQPTRPQGDMDDRLMAQWIVNFCSAGKR